MRLNYSYMVPNRVARAAALACFFLAGPVCASEIQVPTGVLNLGGAIAEALKNSPEIQRQEATVDESHWRKNEVFGSGFLPKISVGASYYFRSREISAYGSRIQRERSPMFPGIFPNKQVTVNGVLPIFDGLANIYHSQAARLNESASEDELPSAPRFVLTEQTRLRFLPIACRQRIEGRGGRKREDARRPPEAGADPTLRWYCNESRYSPRRVQLNEARSDLDDAEDTLQRSSPRGLPSF